MSVNSINMLQTKGQMQAQDLELKQNQVTSLGKSNMSAAEKEKKLREACEGFESIFIQKMWQQMRATLPQENPLVGREEKFWQSMYDQELSKKMASSGGVGLADMMYDQLSQNLVSASRTTAESTGKSRGGFEIAATPLMPQHSMQASEALESGKSALQAAKPHVMADIYDGAASNTGQGQVANQNSNAQTANNNTANLQAVAGQSPAPVQGSSPSSSPLVEQYLTNLLAKQTGQSGQIGQSGQSGQANVSGANLLTGPELARQAQLIATSQPPLHGVLPAQSTPISGNALQAQNALLGANNTAATGTALLQSQISGQPIPNAQPQIIRTTYTTNLPENQRTAQPEITSRAKPKQLLTSGQPMVNNPSSAAYAYGASQSSTDRKAAAETVTPIKTASGG